MDCFCYFLDINTLAMDNRENVNDLIERAWEALQGAGFFNKVDLPDNFHLFARGRFRIKISQPRKKGGLVEVYFNNWITLVRYAVHKAKFEPNIWEYKMKRIYHKECVHKIIYDD